MKIMGIDIGETKREVKMNIVSLEKAIKFAKNNNTSKEVIDELEKVLKSQKRMAERFGIRF